MCKEKILIQYKGTGVAQMLTKNALTVLEKRYFKKDQNGNSLEDAKGLFRRVAKAVAQAEENYNTKTNLQKTEDEFYELMTSLRFLPNSPTLMNAGRPLGQLSACFVLPIEDSMEGIFETIKQAALIHKSGGGTGFSFSRLRPAGSSVNSTGGVASGPVSFMKVFNTATEAVKQGGTRRGANMGILRVDHPDILEFIDCKTDLKEITNFNISVGMTEEFMRAAEKGENYNLIDPKTKEILGQLNAKEVFNKIVNNAWQTGEPGIIFLDRLNKDNVVPKQGEIESTNPCGEQPLLPYESCNLGSINLRMMLEETQSGKEIDFDLLKDTIHKAVHFLDNVIDINKYPIEEIEKTTKLTRKIGLGVMGFADMLLELGVPYNSDKGAQVAEEVMAFIDKEGKIASRNLAKDRGAFPLFEESIYKDQEPIRNGTVTTIAPTGTLSIIGGCSSGVEPVFAYVFIRNVMDNTELIEVNPVLKEKLEKAGLYSEELMRKIAQEGTIAHIEEIPKEIRDIFVSAHDVTPEYHIKMQAAFQKYTDNAVSKTVNFSKEATKQDVMNVYMEAYKTGCKGVTIYRDGSRDSQVLNIGTVNKSGEIKVDNFATQSFNELIPRDRPAITSGFTERMKIGCGNLYVTVNYDENGICEVFTNTGKSGGCPSQSEATARLISIALRAGVDTESIIDQLKGIRCPSTIRQQGMSCTSCPDGIAKIIAKVSQFQKGEANAIEAEKVKVKKQAQKAQKQISNLQEGVGIGDSKNVRFCPECGDKVEHEGGCVICRGCGWGKCG